MAGRAKLVVFSGLPGVGKTTVARALAREIHAVYLRIDSIEHALRSCGLDVEGEGYAVAHAVAEDNLRAGMTVIADCVNPWPLTRDAWHSVAARAHVPVLDIEIVCSRPEEHRRRVESRRADIEGFTLPTWQEVTGRDYHAWKGDRLALDTSLVSVEDAVRAIVAAMRP